MGHYLIEPDDMDDRNPAFYVCPRCRDTGWVRDEYASMHLIVSYVEKPCPDCKASSEASAVPRAGSVSNATESDGGSGISK